MIHDLGYTWRFRAENGRMCLRACDFFLALSIKVAFINTDLFIYLERGNLQHGATRKKHQ